MSSSQRSRLVAQPVLCFLTLLCLGACGDGGEDEDGPGTNEVRFENFTALPARVHLEGTDSDGNRVEQLSGPSIPPGESWTVPLRSDLVWSWFSQGVTDGGSGLRPTGSAVIFIDGLTKLTRFDAYALREHFEE